jgi:hypothetical protein
MVEAGFRVTSAMVRDPIGVRMMNIGKRADIVTGAAKGLALNVREAGL